MTGLQFVIMLFIIFLFVVAVVIVTGRIDQTENRNGGNTFYMEEVYPPGPATYMNQTGATT